MDFVATKVFFNEKTIIQKDLKEKLNIKRHIIVSFHRDLLNFANEKITLWNYQNKK